MRILIVSQFCDPEPHFKGVVFAKELMKLGHDVQILTGFPNYPGGIIYPKYKIRLVQRESIEGVSIIRVALYPSHDNSSIRRVLNFFSFSFFASVLGPFFVKKPDVIYVYYSHITIEIPALMLKIFRGIPVVYDIIDFWPDTLTAIGMSANRCISQVVKSWCHFSYRMADHLIVPSPSQKSCLQERGVPERKISLIYNWCNELQIESKMICSTKKFKIKNRDHFNIVYAGNMGKAQALDVVLEAALVLSNRFTDINFIFIGWGIDISRLQQIKEKKNISNVVFLPQVPVSEIRTIYRMADALLVHLKDIPLFEMTIPSKTQAYLAAGRPIIMAVRGDAAELVEKIEAGITCIPEDVESISSAVEKMYHFSQEERISMGKNGFNYYWKELSMKVGVNKFNEIFNSKASK